MDKLLEFLQGMPLVKAVAVVLLLNLTLAVFVYLFGPEQVAAWLTGMLEQVRLNPKGVVQ